jgi:hypothetical protein
LYIFNKLKKILKKCKKPIDKPIEVWYTIITEGERTNPQTKERKRIRQ